MTWQVFAARRRPRERTDRCVIRTDARGTVLRFNATAARVYGHIPAMILMFDPETRRAALRPAQIDDENAYRLTTNGPQSWLGCKSFLHHYSIPRNGEWEIETDGDLLTFRVDEVQS